MPRLHKVGGFVFVDISGQSRTSPCVGFNTVECQSELDLPPRVAGVRPLDQFVGFEFLRFARLGKALLKRHVFLLKDSAG